MLYWLPGDVASEVITALPVKATVLRDMTPCSLKRFREMTKRLAVSKFRVEGNNNRGFRNITKFIPYHTLQYSNPRRRSVIFTKLVFTTLLRTPSRCLSALFAQFILPFVRSMGQPQSSCFIIVHFILPLRLHSTQDVLWRLIWRR
jgi:hypothetical protein